MQFDTVPTTRIGKHGDCAFHILRGKNYHTGFVQVFNHFAPTRTAGIFCQIEVFVDIDQIPIQQITPIGRQIDYARPKNRLVETGNRRRFDPIGFSIGNQASGDNQYHRRYVISLGEGAKTH